jgi:hypothetical protein
VPVPAGLPAFLAAKWQLCDYFRRIESAGNRYHPGYRTMTLIPASLEDMGTTLFGPDWREPLANALGVALDDVLTWNDDPTAMPAGLEDGLKKIGEIRIREIQFMLGQMNETRLDRSTPGVEGGDAES